MVVSISRLPKGFFAKTLPYLVRRFALDGQRFDGSSRDREVRFARALPYRPAGDVLWPRAIERQRDESVVVELDGFFRWVCVHVSSVIHFTDNRELGR
jgi:hypothetical protein